MTPLPKYVSIISGLATVFAALNVVEVLTVVGPKLAAVISVAAVSLAALSHSLGGAGGK